MNNGIFSSRMVKLRKERGMSQKNAAADLGISQALLSHYEKGIRECSLDFICKVSAYYDVSCDYLLGQVDVVRTLSEEFDVTDTVQDKEFRISTLLRSAAMLNDSLESNGCVVGDNIKEFLAMSIYKIALCAAESGSIPKEWLTLNRNTSASFCLAIMENLSHKEQFNMKAKSDQPSPVQTEPLCVKTIIEKAESIIINEVKKLST